MASFDVIQENLRAFAEKTWPDNPRFKKSTTKKTKTRTVKDRRTARRLKAK